MNVTVAPSLDAGAPCLLGLACWAWAVITCLMASMLTIVGFVLQKKAQSDLQNAAQASLDSQRTVGDIICSAKWVIGFLLVGLIPMPLVIWSYSHAPMSLTTPLSGVGIIMNMVLAPWLLGESLQRWPDIPAAFCILLGSLLTTASGSHEEQSFDIDDLTRLLFHAVFITALVPLLCAILYCIGYMERRRLQIEMSAMQRPTNPNMVEVCLPALVAAGCGCIANITLKGIGELLQGGSGLAQSLLWALIGVIPAVAQINYVNRGLRLYLQCVFLPVYTSMLLIMNTLYGQIFFQEYTGLSQADLLIFVLGVSSIVIGVLLFTFRQSEKSAAETSLATELAGEMGPQVPKRNISGSIDARDCEVTPDTWSNLDPPAASSWRIID